MGEMAIWLALIGAVLGVVTLGQAGLLFGAVIGFLLGQVYHLGRRLQTVEEALAARVKRHGVPEEEPQTARVPAREPVKPTGEAVPESPEPSFAEEPPAKTEVPVVEQRETAAAATPSPAGPFIDIELPESEGQSTESRFWQSIVGFFTDSNAVVRVGIVVLFFGVAFLIKYAADRNLFPIEMRLAAAAIGGIGLIALGWYLRLRRTAYALLIQGGGIGIFYITVYGAAKIYHLIPLGMSFGLMVAIVSISALLAILQESRNLAAFGISGGFLAPILTSTGEGSHVMLFSYYALLNAGILGIAWFKAWRELNLLGFLFTFVIGTFWGAQYYRPAYFETTEPFLILFTLFYVAIAVLFALRQPLKLRGYVDGTLVFGVPVVGFALQAGLVKDFEYGMAWSALALAVLYILLANMLWRRRIEGMRLLTESFLALGVAFATLAIPLALDARWTASAWALEGAAILWVGIRQQRLLPRVSGLLMQLGAGVSYLLVLGQHSGGTPVLNGLYLSALLIAIAGLFSSYCMQHWRERLRPGESDFHIAVLIWGLMWWYGAGMHEIDRFVVWEHRINARLLFIALSSGALLWLWQRLAWSALRYTLLLLLPGAGLLSVNIIEGSGQIHFFASWGLPAWAAVFAVQYRILWQLEGKLQNETMMRFGHSATLWLVLGILTWEANWWVQEWLQRGVWDYAVLGLLPALAITLIMGPAGRLKWPVAKWVDTYRGVALLPVVLAVWLWSLLAMGSSGDPWPLPYIPLLNPLELSQLFVVLVVLVWSWRNRNDALLKRNGFSLLLGWVAVGIAGFSLLNEVVAHSVHYWTDTPYHFSSLYRSVVFQTTISVVWTLTALIVTVLATQKGQRVVWFVGATLLAAVVVKLFLIDLSRSDTMERIISFIAVGILMLAIGYFSPLPPKQQGEKQ